MPGHGSKAVLGRLCLALFALVLGATAFRGHDASAQTPRWVGAWASSQMIPDADRTLPDGTLDDTTVRQIVRLTLGGSAIRVRISNVFGVTPLVVTAASVARPVAIDGAAINPASVRLLSFSGSRGVTIPAGAEFTSDPLPMEVSALDSLTVSLYYAAQPSPQTTHPGARATSYLAKGDLVTAADLPSARTVDNWFNLAGVDILGSDKAAAIVIIGDSITDGYGVPANSNGRWPDALAERLQSSPQTAHLSVLNQGIGGNRVLLDGLGPNALARFERDVLGQPGVGYFVILEGVNDLGHLTRNGPATARQHADLVHSVTAAYAQMVERARARGIKAIGATIMPFTGSDYYHPPAETEADRNAINAWIRTPGNFDAVIDFDAATRDPNDPTRLRAEVDNDHLHPSVAGYRAMADAVPLSLFEAARP